MSKKENNYIKQNYISDSAALFIACLIFIAIGIALNILIKFLAH